MALIEGVGDEVTVLCASLLLISLIVLAWISTHTSERGSSPWSSQAYGGHGSEQELRQPVTGGTRPPGSDEGTTSPDSSPISEEPSGSSDHEPMSSPDSPTPHNRESAGVRHRGPPAPGDTMTLRLKFLNDTERVVNVRPTDSVLHIKRSQFPGQEPRVRLIYQGQLLRDDSQTVASLQLTDGCVLHCHLSQHASSSASGGPEPSQDSVNMGSLLVPFFLLLLGIVWYCRFQYPQVFNATSTASLGAMTLFVLVLVYSSCRR